MLETQIISKYVRNGQLSEITNAIHFHFKIPRLAIYTGKPAYKALETY